VSEWHADAAPVRRVVHHTRGHAHGPITRLVSPGDFGQVIKPFVFLDYFDIEPKRAAGGVWHTGGVAGTARGTARWR
jgi:hypothetical protein